MIFPECESKTLEQQISSEIPVLSEEILKHAKERLSKAFYIKDYDSVFVNKYPLMCIPNPCTSEK